MLREAILVVILAVSLSEAIRHRQQIYEAQRVDPIETEEVMIPQEMFQHQQIVAKKGPRPVYHDPNQGPEPRSPDVPDVNAPSEITIHDYVDENVPINFDNKNCADLDKSLTEREQEATVILTGTVREIHASHDDTLRAQVEIKRVLKGGDIVESLATIKTLPSHPWAKTIVFVDGLNDHNICDSFINKGDTRIFLLEQGTKDDLKLKSSLLRLTLKNIDQADEVVKEQKRKALKKAKKQAKLAKKKKVPTATLR